MLESKYDDTIAKPTASAIGTNSACAAPCRRQQGHDYREAEDLLAKGQARTTQRVQPDQFVDVWKVDETRSSNA